MKRTTTARPTRTSTTTTVKTENIMVKVTEDQALALPGSLHNSHQEEGKDIDEERDDDEQEGEEIEEVVEDVEEDEEEKNEVLLSGCLNQSRSGTVKVGQPKLNEDGRDFHLRVCDQETNGGGWTVGGSMSSSVEIFVIVCMLGCWCC